MIHLVFYINLVDCVPWDASKFVSMKIRNVLESRRETCVSFNKSLDGKSDSLKELLSLDSRNLAITTEKRFEMMKALVLTLLTYERNAVHRLIIGELKSQYSNNRRQDQIYFKNLLLWLQNFHYRKIFYFWISYFKSN